MSFIDYSEFIFLTIDIYWHSKKEFIAKMPKVKQPSRKTKSTWRKNIDLTGVEASLENQRAAERLGLAPITSNTHASSLFVEDRVGDESIKKKAGKKPLKSLAILREKDEGSSPVIGRARRGVMDTLTKKKSGKGNISNM